MAARRRKSCSPTSPATAATGRICGPTFPATSPKEVFSFHLKSTCSLADYGRREPGVHNCGGWKHEHGKCWDCYFSHEFLSMI
jgi:hypothetical protein